MVKPIVILGAAGAQRGRRSPASTLTPSLLTAGATGQVAKSVKEHDRFAARLKSSVTDPSESGRPTESDLAPGCVDVHRLGVGSPPPRQICHAFEILSEPMQAGDADPAQRVTEVALALGVPLRPLRLGGGHDVSFVGAHHLSQPHAGRSRSASDHRDRNGRNAPRRRERHCAALNLLITHGGGGPTGTSLGRHVTIQRCLTSAHVRAPRLGRRQDPSGRLVAMDRARRGCRDRDGRRHSVQSITRPASTGSTRRGTAARSPTTRWPTRSPNRSRCPPRSDD